MKEFEYPLHAIHSGGHVHHIPDEEAARHLGRGFGVAHVEPGVAYRDDPYRVFGARRNEWIVRDDWGAVVAPDDLPSPRRNAPWWAERHEQVQHAAMLGLAIPGTGKKVYGRYRRKIRLGMKGVSDAASTAADLADLGMTGRRVARAAEHVDGRLSPPRSEERCWKSQRRTRWK